MIKDGFACIAALIFIASILVCLPSYIQKGKTAKRIEPHKNSVAVTKTTTL